MSEAHPIDQAAKRTTLIAVGSDDPVEWLVPTAGKPLYLHDWRQVFLG